MTYFFKKIYILRLCYPDILLYILLYPVCKFFLHRTKQCDQKYIKIVTRRDIWQIVYVQSSFLPKRGKKDNVGASMTNTMSAVTLCPPSGIQRTEAF